MNTGPQLPWCQILCFSPVSHLKNTFLLLADCINDEVECVLLYINNELPSLSSLWKVNSVKAAEV